MPQSKILPFKGLMYSKEKVANLADVVTPPYDVISPEMQEGFYNKSPHNFVKVDFNREAGDAKYEAAGKEFQNWLRQKVLIQDDKPAIYFHHQIFKLPDGTEVTRKGFFAVRRIEDFSEGGVKPHEKTLDGPKADRLKLTRVTQSNLSPVFSLYSDAEQKIDHLIKKLKMQEPHFDFVSSDNERHQLWKESDPIICKMIADTLQEKAVFIADGHHRYETAINYRNECRKSNPPGDGLEAFNYVLMYFSNMDDDGLIILPIHRALHNLKNFNLDDFLNSLSKHFKVTPLKSDDANEITKILAEEGKDSHAYALLTKDPNRSYVLSIRRKEWLNSPVSISVSKSLVDLDVTVLHRLVLEEILRISPQDQADQTNIIYWKDTKKAINETRKGGCDVTFLLNPTRIGDMKQVAMAGEKMPQKSTYFFPKILSGLVIYPLK